MIFLSYWFILFVAVFFPLYWFIPNLRIKQILLLAACIVFYTHFAGGFVNATPILTLGVISYWCGLSRQKWLCILGIVLCAIALIFYKYTVFLLKDFFSIFSSITSQAALNKLELVLPETPPLAISFFVFEFVHYLIDVLRGNSSITSPFQFALFGMFFPSLVAGPIKRYENFIPQTQNPAQLNRADLVYGAVRIAAGIAKKIAADNLTIYINFWDKSFESIPLHSRWLVLLLISLRIYWDFSGYSDMAIGYAHLLGIKLPENFNFPYIAKSLREFWQRWHISLSTWIRDYIYIPLGGNRYGMRRKILNGIIAFGVCGLWHGAGWNFLIWGLWHGFGLAISSNYKTLLGYSGQHTHTMLNSVPFLSWGITFLYVSLGWLLFFYPIDRAWTMAKLLFGLSG